MLERQQQDHRCDRCEGVSSDPRRVFVSIQSTDDKRLHRLTCAGSLSWAYTGIQGALTFCQDKVKGGLWFRVVDLIVSDSAQHPTLMNGMMLIIMISTQSTRGIVWEHELPLELEYNQDRGFFHSFGGDVRNTSRKR